jgi:predicted RNase H-like nuclease (RuvC/YqgF family)
MDHHFGGKGGGKAGVDGAFGGKGKGKAGVKGAFGGGSEGKDAFVNPPQINKLNEAIRQLRRQNRAQSEKLNKYRGAVNSLREQLEDLNLFNAKLLYVNKLLQNKSLNESQKKSVIKALDEAQSLQEAKSLYSSLTETFGRGGKKTISESRVFGSSSKTTTSSQSTATSSNNELSRWQRLAGL